MVAGWLLLSAACTGAAQPGTEPSVAPMSTSATPPSGASAQPTTLARRRSRTQVALVTAELRNELVVVEHARVQLEDLGQWPQRGPAGEGSRAPFCHQAGCRLCSTRRRSSCTSRLLPAPGGPTTRPWRLVVQADAGELGPQ